jgi:hypothetical protein
MQNPIGLHVAPIHGHFGAQEILPDLKNSDAKGTGQAICQPGFDGFGGGWALPNWHVNHLSFFYNIILQSREQVRQFTNALFSQFLNTRDTSVGDDGKTHSCSPTASIPL